MYSATLRGESGISDPGDFSFSFHLHVRRNRVTPDQRREIAIANLRAEERVLLIPLGCRVLKKAELKSGLLERIFHTFYPRIVLPSGREGERERESFPPRSRIERL